MLELDYPIKDLVGADYNPREIDEESLKTLRQSIKTLGIVKPIIVSGNLIVAGHQRTKALLAAGIDKAPVYLLPENINQTDEIRFNQLHNGTDFDSGDERAWVGRSENLGFEWCFQSSCAAICGQKWRMSAMKSVNSLSNMATGELVSPLKQERLFTPDNMFWLAKQWEFLPEFTVFLTIWHTKRQSF